MQLDLTADEARELRDILASVLSDLRVEIGRTDTYDFRERLHEREARLRRVLEALEGEAGV
ncbi:MAG TPA: hypothetical protein VFS08_03690 [Gemmatimonadaceae bacterium]|nr:hypothetical protein [Gemmatimonadaceae bacterium]